MTTMHTAALKTMRAIPVAAKKNPMRSMAYKPERTPGSAESPRAKAPAAQRPKPAFAITKKPHAPKRMAV